MSTAPLPSIVGQLRFANEPLVYYRRTAESQLASRDPSWCGESRSPLSEFDRAVAEMSEKSGENPIVCMAMVRAERAAPQVRTDVPRFENVPGGMTVEERRAWWMKHAPPSGPTKPYTAR